MLYGADASAKVLSTQHRRSPFIQGGLEIPIEVTVRMEFGTQNNQVIMKYTSLDAIHYKEPTDSILSKIADMMTAKVK